MCSTHTTTTQTVLPPQEYLAVAGKRFAGEAAECRAKAFLGLCKRGRPLAGECILRAQFAVEPRDISQ